MRPSRDDGSEEGEFLGVQLRLARWHLGPAPQLERPPQVMGVREVAVISPQYQGAQSLPNQGLELDRLKLVFGFRAGPGRLDTVGSLAASPPPGIVHFLGHGIVKTSAQGIPEYSVRLEDADVDITTWRGLTVGPTASHPLFFFNACDLGGAQRVASFVEGWAPAVLDAGASGYVGGLWPLGDRGAAMFARRFYDGLDPAFRGKPVVVSDLLRQARRGFYETGDPTFLAYVFYGDPLLALRATSQP
jgi:CHAT domain-containing protein